MKIFYQKISAFVLALVFILEPSKAFFDLPNNHFAFGSVASLVEADIYPDTDYFYPDEAVSRCEFVEKLIDSMGYKTAADDIYAEAQTKNYTYASFTDLPIDYTCAGEVMFAREQGIISGYSGNTFRPLEKINRAEASKILVKAFLNGEFSTGINPNFRDVEPTAWYYPYVLTANQNGLLTGYKDTNGLPTGYFGVNNNLTRAELAVILSRGQLFEKVNYETDYLNYTAVSTSPEAIIIAFSAPVSSAALDQNNYSLENQNPTWGIDIAQIIQEDSSTIRLITSAQYPNNIYNLEFKNITSADETKSLKNNLGYITIYGYTTEPAMGKIENLNIQTEDQPLTAYASDVEFLHFKLTSIGDGPVIISSLKIKHSGVGDTRDLTDIRVLVDGTQVAQKNNFSSGSAEVEIYFNPPYSANSNTEQDVKVLANFTPVSTGISQHQFEITSANSFTLANNSQIQGNFPIKGPKYTRSNVEGGYIQYTFREPEYQPEVGERSVLLEAILQAFGEDMTIEKIVFENTSSLSDDYFQDCILRIDRRKVGEAVDGATDGKIVFDLSDSPYTLEKNDVKAITLTSKLAGGGDETVMVNFAETNPLTAKGDTYGYGIAFVKSPNSPDPIPLLVTGYNFLVAQAPDNPSGYTIYSGESKQTVAKFEFSGQGSEYQISNMTFWLETNDMQNFPFEELKIYWGGKEISNYSPNNNTLQSFRVNTPLILKKDRSSSLTIKATLGDAVTEDIGTFRIYWKALEESSANFNVKRSLDDRNLGRSDISPKGDLTLYGGKFTVKTDPNKLNPYY